MTSDQKIVYAQSFAPGPVYISELLARGNDSIHDQDNDQPDWIELYNPGDQAINLAGWFLSDDSQNLEKWTFPDVTIEAGDFLLIFASGKNRTAANGELHSNFRLSAAGEFLALTKANGEISHAYVPNFPDQTITNKTISYGIFINQQQLIQPNHSLKYFVPQDGSLGQQWAQPTFDDASWLNAQNGIGFGSQEGSFQVTVYHSTIEVNSLANADRVVRSSRLQDDVVTGTAPVINFFATGQDGEFGNNLPFPGQTIGQDLDDFVTVATGEITIPRSGTWTFGLNTDDGCRLRINGQDVIVDDTTHAPENNFATINLNAGTHQIEALMFERSGGAGMEFFAAFGRHDSFDPNVFHLVGDSANGGISKEGFAELIQHDISEAMHDQNASLYLRYPFSTENSIENGRLLLNVNYNDGFIAYINGEEIARRNAPDDANWNSSALQPRDPKSTNITETIPINIDLSQLKSAPEALLAVHALNASAADDDFLFKANLTAYDFNAEQNRYFLNPTPGFINEEGLLDFLPAPTFSHQHGFYESPIDVTISSSNINGIIRFTTDGTAPSLSNGETYTEPLTINQTTTLRAGIFLDNHAPSILVTQSYLFLDDILRQTRPEGYPTSWSNGVSADYDMDPDITFGSYADTIRDDLKSLPIMSIVMDPDDLFGSSQGIYSHTLSRGVAWERPASVELIHPDGNKEGFQINCGIRIQGGYSRDASLRKHSLRLLFKSDYGPTKLNYPLFDHSPVDSFDTITLRSNYNYTWHGQEGGFGISGPKAEYMRDEFSRRTQLATGQVASHGTFVHLYLNGLYWGVYNPCERPDASFAAHHYGGDKEEWDTVTGGSRELRETQVKNGNKDAWLNMMELARSNLALDSNYEAIQEYADIDNLIDYMLTIYYTGNRDAPTVIGGANQPWNFYTNHWRKPGSGFKFFAWDSEWSLENLNVNTVTFHNGYDDPSTVFNALKRNDNFLIRVADRIQKHFFNGGAMTPEASRQRYQEMIDLLDRAIVGESARWGDKNGGRPKTRDNDWIPEIRRIRDDYLVKRTDVVLNQLQNAGLYPVLPAPVFSQHGGPITQGYQLRISTETLNEAIKNQIFQFESQWRFHQTGALPSSWKTTSFDDTDWQSGTGLFYVENASLPAAKNTPLTLGETTYYFRKTFNLDADLYDDAISAEIETIIDDGAVVYINGNEVMRQRMPDGNITHSTFANATVSDAQREGPFSLPLSALVSGENLIAVEVHQTNANSSDIVFGLSLSINTQNNEDAQLPVYFTTNGTDPRESDGSISPTAVLYDSPLLLHQSQHIKARTYSNNTWSAQTAATFTTGTFEEMQTRISDHLKISELMYNPADGNEYEFIELTNTHPTLTLDLSGVSFINGVQFTFRNNTLLAPGEFILITNRITPAELTDFRDYYKLSPDVTITGPYIGLLANEGEQIEMLAQDGTRIINFTYNDGRGWTKAADGAGHSLVPREEIMDIQSDGYLNYGRHWRASTYRGGSPGEADPATPLSLVINEFQAATDDENLSSNDWIEIYNPTNEAISLRNWYLSDDNEDLRQFALPNIELSPHGFAYFDEINDFNNPQGSGFALNRNGETLYLSYIPTDRLLERVADVVNYQGQLKEFSSSRYPDGGEFFSNTAPTPNNPNAEPVSSVIISELMYHPPAIGESIIDNIQDEYIEIYNSTDATVSFFNDIGPWCISGGIDFTFPQNTTLDAKQSMVLVSFDPSTTTINEFRNTYNLDESINIIGPYTRVLSNQGERISLESPISLDEFNTPNAWHVVDEIIYFDMAPWFPEADGGGMSLQRMVFNQSGNDPASWQAAQPTPGNVNQTRVQSWSLY